MNRVAICYDTKTFGLRGKAYIFLSRTVLEKYI